MREERSLVRVWDPFVRVSHWSLVVAFTVAYLTEDDPALVHEIAGYTVGGLVAARVIWGFIGPRHARFTDFVRRPSVVFAYALRLATLRSERHLGHSPAGGAMVVALLIMLGLTVGTGIVADDEAIGGSRAAMAGAAFANENEERDEGEKGDEGEREESAFGEIHESLANLTLLLVILHVGGVVLASFAHRENLVRAMITGFKRP